MWKPAKVHAPCVHQGCSSQAKSFGRCLTHYWQLKREQPEEIIRLKAMTGAERDHEFYKLNHPPLPPWEYEPTEAQTQELVRVCSRQSQRNIRIGETTMAEPFTRKNTPSLTKIVDATMDGSYGSFEALKNSLHTALGTKTAEDLLLDNPSANYERPEDAPAASSMPAHAQQGNPTHERVIYPLSNDRYILTGFSDEELDVKEARIRAALGVQ
jgi:hypothetical protein